MVQQAAGRTTMLTGQKVILRAVTRADLERLCQFNNDVEVEVAGGGDPPTPQSLARLQADYDVQVSHPRTRAVSLWYGVANGVGTGQLRFC